jgi:hypothetical protein
MSVHNSTMHQCKVKVNDSFQIRIMMSVHQYKVK